MLQFRDFRKSYGDKLIVAAKELRLEAPFYWLKGGNGSGKTSLLQSIAGIIPFSGGIEVNGKRAQAQPVPFRLAVNSAAAEPLYPDFLTGSDLIRLYTQTKKGTEAQVSGLTAQLGIRDFMAGKTGTYSSGMKKKLSLVLAFIGQPELILLDEPLITLDSASVALLLQLIDDALMRGTQMLITSHQDLPSAFTRPPQPLIIADRQLTIAL